MNKQALAREFGQLFILAFDGPSLSAELEEFINTFNIGGLIFFSDNFESPQQFTALVKDIQDRCSSGTPLFISTDHEGGKRQEFTKGFTRIPSMGVAGTKNPADTLQLYRQMGRELRNVGVNLNFAPVADLCAGNTPGSIGDRSFGTDTASVTQHVLAAIEGLQAEGVLACVKHFPGHGATAQNSHQELPTIHLTVDELLRQDLVPFGQAIKAGVASVMTAHIVYPAGDAQWPASLSHFWITEILRKQLAFNGAIISDALEMKALTNHWDTVTCGVKAFEAGTDILLYYREKNQFQTFYELRMAFERGELDAKRVEESLERVRVMKRKL
jgi:beta-N-acetylhexosaminidase